MSLHPIRALDHVIEEYKDYLSSEFRAKDPALRKALEDELDRPLFLAQEPFFQAHRPFRSGKRWKDLPLDAKLAEVMEARAKEHGSPTPEFTFQHQSDAIENLLGAAPRPVVVTTGTGSGKTEAFLLPVIQNAIMDAATFERAGLTAILVYPMNALANDQMERIESYLEESGFGDKVRVAKYDRGTSQSEREKLRANPPHILLTNYMMLEYLLVRPKDREGIFSNHRCHFLVLDEVHTYRGTLGSNIALLVRRLKAHLDRAPQDWNPEVPKEMQERRFPSLIPVGTSATIKSISEEGVSPVEARRLRDEAVQDFFGKLTGAEPTSILVLGEEIQDLATPPEAVYPTVPSTPQLPQDLDGEPLRLALCNLAGVPHTTPLDEAVRRCRIFWDLNRWLVKSPMSASKLAEKLRKEIPARQQCDEATCEAEVEAALAIGAALPDGILGALRLRVHRFLRGGWKFHRCVSPECGRLFPMGEDRCSCGSATAPLYLCRNCGADYFRFVGEEKPESLRPSAVETDDLEWMLYQPSRFEGRLEDDEDGEEPEDETGARARKGKVKDRPTQVKKRTVYEGSFDPKTLSFSIKPETYPLKAIAVPARTRCLCCGGSAGSRNILTAISLGTSAALKVISEGLLEALQDANKDRAGYDGKERLLIFSDSRQDAAHQARFIIFASRYDRMRSRLAVLLKDYGDLSIQKAVELLGELGVKESDNPHRPPGEVDHIHKETLERIRAWEEAPLLDEIATSASYRGTLINLGVVGIQYDQLQDCVEKFGQDLARNLGIATAELTHICRCLLDEIRVRGALSRELLKVHPASPSCPDFVRAAEWERRVRFPQGYPCDASGNPKLFMDPAEGISGIKVSNAWRSPSSRGRGPSLERILKSLMERFGGVIPTADHMLAILTLLKRTSFLVASPLAGKSQKKPCLQLQAESLRLVLLNDGERFRCEVCGTPLGFSFPAAPCPKCRGRAVPWLKVEVDENRFARKVFNPSRVPLVAGEHTAQVTGSERAQLETDFKASGLNSRVNVLACSPTLEMGIDVGGLDAVALRNVPPRPDNYAQRGGRAGRRRRVGLVLGFARNTPHDQYFYDRPEEMISGEVPAPGLALGNRDVLQRHIHSIAFGLADPGLSGKMADYVETNGTIREETLKSLIGALEAQFANTEEVAKAAFGPEILEKANLGAGELAKSLSDLPARIREVVERTSRQVIELRQALDKYYSDLMGPRQATRAGDLITRLLGIQTERSAGGAEADDRSAGYPMRRLAEFGILPGYEFPTEPATLRLLGEKHEEDPVSVGRRFGIVQFMPGAQAYARNKRWRVLGLDSSSPWNPRSDAPSLLYTLCASCRTRYQADLPRCPRCWHDQPVRSLPAFEFGGFLAVQEEIPVLMEEDRIPPRNLLKTYPQWDGTITGRWLAAGAWPLSLAQNERILWLNEGYPPTDGDTDRLHDEARGFLLCGTCGRSLKKAEKESAKGKGTQKPKKDKGNPFEHAANCPQIAVAPKPCAILADSQCEVLRLKLPVPMGASDDAVRSWGLSLGYALRLGMRHLYALDGPEVEFEFEGPWTPVPKEENLPTISLSFIDPSLGGTGYLRRAAHDFHLVAARALDHLEHPGCQTACYRCLKSYTNQRVHALLDWTVAHPALEALSLAAPEAKPLEKSDLDDPGPWLEAYAAGVGSPLELKFLRLFEAHGFHPQKQVPITPSGASHPITLADFAVTERRLAIYIDGASVHVGQRLRRDRIIRKRLRDADPPWTVMEFGARDLGQGASLVNKLRSGGTQIFRSARSPHGR
jgi:replicative superfamily II helicase/predicted  nucleic acid-binding Zn-ribbon protein